MGAFGGKIVSSGNGSVMAWGVSRKRMSALRGFGAGFGAGAVFWLASHRVCGLVVAVLVWFVVTISSCTPNPVFFARSALFNVSLVVRYASQSAAALAARTVF